MDKTKIRGNGQIAFVTSVISLVAAVAAPVIWVTSIKAHADVQDVNVKNLQDFQVSAQEDLKQLNQKVDALLWKNGINPQSVVSQAQSQQTVAQTNQN